MAIKPSSTQVSRDWYHLLRWGCSCIFMCFLLYVWRFIEWIQVLEKLPAYFFYRAVNVLLSTVKHRSHEIVTAVRCFSHKTITASYSEVRLYRSLLTRDRRERSII